MKRQTYPLLLTILATLCAAFPAGAQDDRFAGVQIRTEKIAEKVWMLQGAGGNMALHVGDDTAFLVDDQFAPLTEKILAAIAEITDQPVRFVLNTHWHGDHTGGNENLGQAGALIVAHDNVRARMSVEQFMEAFDRTVPAAPAAALPAITFPEALTFHLNGEEIHAFHVQPAHTDGDTIVHFKGSDVIHTGDTFFNGRYPFIDVSSGGSITGVIRAANRVLEIVGPDTKIIPGHGSVATAADLVAYRDMLDAVRRTVAPMVRAGQSLDDVLAAKPTAEFDEAWGGADQATGFLTWTYESLKRWFVKTIHDAPSRGPAAG